LLRQVPPPLLITASALAALVIVFFVLFLVPAIRHLFRLRKIANRLNALSDRSPVALGEVFAADERLNHLWNEFAETLHKQSDTRDGMIRVLAVRSTVPAESYFNSQFVVDSRVHAEFFRHLPGIFTGIGIIGTFSGLIGGLRTFQSGLNLGATDSLQIQGPLRALLQEVGTAFMVSASAITAAMLVTLIEKALLSSLYRYTEEIAQAIDRCFNSGAGEEYLARIVQASEESASQSRILKDALVGDLRELLREATHSQIASAREQNQILALGISNSINDSLREPLQQIAGTVRTASGDQSAAATRMLQDVFSSFSQRLQELFGGQIAGINDLNKQAVGSLNDVVGRLGGLVRTLEDASANSGEALAGRMADAMEKMDQRQDSINAQTGAFVDQLRQLVAVSQTETNQRLQETLASVGRQVAGMVASLEAVHQQSLEGNRQREETLATHTTSAVSTMTGSVDAVVREMAAAATAMQEAVGEMSRITSASLDKMAYGADTLNAASNRFAEAGASVIATMTEAAAVATQLRQLGGTMSSSSSVLQRTVEDYGKHRDAVAQMLSELRQVVDRAGREASLTADVLQRIEEAANKLGLAQREADAYLLKVNEVLANAHESFADATLRTLGRVNADFHNKLSSAVGLLSSSIQELEATIGSR
jgi:hypothetical protein